MPVISIKSLPLSRPMSIGAVLKKMNVEVARETGYEPRNIWSYWLFIDRHMYAVGDVTAAVIEPQSHSPIIEITGFEGKSDELIENMMRTVARVISEEMQIEVSNIFITYNEVRSGRVFDGGEIVYKK
jgi:phenylpyruvate tautomerase PptA (4-oxalocrotonate tautomerase family)